MQVPGRLSGSARAARGGAGSVHELAVLLEQLPVKVDGAALAQVGDHVPVDGRAVGTARRRVRLPQRQVHRTADLLVVQDALDRPLDRIVGADAQLAQVTGARVAVQLRLQQVITQFRFRLHHLTLFRSQADVAHLDSVDAAGDVVGDDTFGA